MSEASETKAVAAETKAEILFEIRMLGRDIEIVRKELGETGTETKSHDRVLFRSMSNGDPSMVAQVDEFGRFKRWVQISGSGVLLLLLGQLILGGYSFFLQQRVETEVQRAAAEVRKNTVVIQQAVP